MSGRTNRRMGHWLAVLMLLGLLTGCQNDRDPIVAVPQPVATLRATVPLPTTAPTLQQSPANEPSDTNWQPIGNGVELRRIKVAVEDRPGLANITITRFDPTQIRFHVGYTPRQPQSLDEWVAATSPLAIINGGFFNKDYTSTSLVISGGQATGESYVGRGGMFAVTSNGAIVLRSLADEPYAADESFAEAIQSWPMLVKTGGIAAYTDDEKEFDQRSVVARDRAGRVLFFVCSTGSFTLRGLSQWLAASDLDIDTALNLDGGSSTSLYLQNQVRIDPFGKLPLVLVADYR